MESVTEPDPGSDNPEASEEPRFLAPGYPALPIIRWSVSHDHVIRHGRSCVFYLPMHRVFATKYRRGGFTKAVLEDLQDIFACVCVEAKAKRVEFDSDDDRVILLSCHSL